MGSLVYNFIPGFGLEKVEPGVGVNGSVPWYIPSRTEFCSSAEDEVRKKRKQGEKASLLGK